MGKAKWIIKSPTKEQESYLQQAGRIGTSAGLKGLESIENAADFVGVKNAHAPSKYLRETFDLPEDEEPEGFLSSAANKFAQAAPYAAGLAALPVVGGSVLGSLAATAAGSVVGAGVQQLGLPEWAQDLAQFGTEIASGRPINGLTKTKKAADTALRAAGNTGKHLFTETPVALATVKDALTTAGKGINKQVKGILQPVFSNLSKSMGDPVKLLDARKWINHETRKWSPVLRATFATPITESITKDLVQYGSKHPEFLKNLQVRDQLTMYNYMSTPITDTLKKFPFVGKYLGKEFVKSIAKPEKFVKGIYKYPEARNLFTKMTASSLANDPEKVIKYGNELKRYIPGFEEVEEKFTAPNKWIIK